MDAELQRLLEKEVQGAVSRWLRKSWSAERAARTRKVVRFQKPDNTLPDKLASNIRLRLAKQGRWGEIQKQIVRDAITRAITRALPAYIRKEGGISRRG